MTSVTPTPIMQYSDLSGVVSAITNEFSVSSITGILAGALGVAVGFVFFWWATRKVTRMIFGAAKKGKARV